MTNDTHILYSICKFCLHHRLESFASTNNSVRSSWSSFSLSLSLSLWTRFRVFKSLKWIRCCDCLFIAIVTIGLIICSHFSPFSFIPYRIFKTLFHNKIPFVSYVCWFAFCVGSIWKCTNYLLRRFILLTLSHSWVCNYFCVVAMLWLSAVRMNYFRAEFIAL